MAVAMIVGFPLAGAGVWEMSQNYGHARAGPSPTTFVSSEQIVDLCGMDFCSAHSHVQTIGIEYIPGGDIYVAGVSGGPIVVLSATNGSLLGANSLNCSLETEFYPGTGPDVYFECYTTQSQASILIFDWELREVIRSVSLSGSSSNNIAFNLAAGLVYYQTYQGAARGHFPTTLSATNLTTGVFVSKVPVPAGVSNSQSLVYDNATGILYYDDLFDNSVVALRPATGEILASAEVPGFVTSMTLDRSGDRLWAATSSASGTGSNITLLETAPLGVVHTDRNLSAHMIYTAVTDPLHGNVYFASDSGILVLNSSTDEITTTIEPGRVVYALTWNPELDEFGFVGEAGAYSADASLINLTYGFTSPPPLSGFPVLGSSLPFIVALSGVITGAAILGTLAPRRIWDARRMRAEESRKAFEDLIRGSR
ncbi:MAG: hypothetical protein L3K23_02120 [Thermoplasmata archaeon]|nr:hypothetical protein [Thermoplasmata archaeon]